MASTMTLKPTSVMKMRHSAHAGRATEHKQVRIERSKSVNVNICVSREDSICVENEDSNTEINTNKTENDVKDHDNTVDNNKFKETTVFLTAAKRMTREINRLSPPLEIRDLTDDQLDAYYFEDPEQQESKSSSFDEKQYYQSMCEKHELLPSSSFLRQMDKPRCNLSCMALTEKDIRPIAVALVNNSKITEIDLSENEIGKRGMYHIAEALTENVFVTRAKFSRVGLDADCMRYLVEGLKGNKTLTQLDLSTNHLNAKSAVYIAKMIQENDFIVELVLHENDLDDEAGRIMAKAIASNLTIRKLDLSWNHLRGRGASDVVKAICDNVELLEVNLSWNGIGEEGSIAFGKHLQKNHTLRILDISYSRINILHLGHVLKGLKYNDTLETLKITGNPFTTDGAIAILKCLQSSSKSVLKELYLEDSPISDEFLVVYEELKGKKDIKVHHKEPNKKKISSILRERKLEDYDPLLLLFEFMRQENFRLLDLFRTFDKNHDNMISKQELKDGFLKFSLDLPEEKLDSLMSKLDADSNHVVDLHELISGRRQAAHTRHIANKDSTGRMAESLRHLKSLVEHARKDKYQKQPNDINDTVTPTNNKHEKDLTRQKSMTAIIQFPEEMKDILQSVLK